MHITPKKVKTSLFEVIRNMKNESHRFAKNPGKDFTRNSKCNLETMTKIILGFEDHCLNSELKDYFKLNIKQLPRKSTFTQQRNKLTDDAFLNLFEDFNAKFPFKKKKYGLHLVACDGSDVNMTTLFEDKVYFVENCVKNGEGFYQLHCNAFYDLLEKRYKDVHIQPRPKFDEGSAFCTMLHRAEHESDYSTLYICDRGYFSWNLAANVIESKQYFLIRAKGMRSSNSAFKGIEMPDDGEFDIKRSLKLIRSSAKKYRENPNEYRCLTNKRTFDFIDSQDHESVYQLDLRIVSVLLPTGEYEYLLTNLPDKFTPTVLKELYRMRWGEETAFRKLKYNCALNNFHSVKRNFIMQELYARLLMYNYTELIISTAKVVQKPEFKHLHKVSFTNAAKVARMYLTINYENDVVIKNFMGSDPPYFTMFMFIYWNLVKPCSNAGF